ncbi:MAG TPA: acyl carrier protein [bacterium]|nr:acyl carrier protein [bacterium]
MNTSEEVRQFILSELINGTGSVDIDDETELIESGIIDSLGIMKLLTFIETKFAAKIDESELMPENFHSIDAIRALLNRLNNN